jgi:hypothetical protein
VSAIDGRTTGRCSSAGSYDAIGQQITLDDAIDAAIADSKAAEGGANG